MSLSKLSFSTETIETSAGPLTVRGLSLSDLIPLVRKHEPVVRRLYDQFVAGREASEDDLIAMAGGLVSAVPDLVADVIAYACDEPELADVAKRLPLPAQVAAVEKIGLLTFAGEGGPKKVVETVIRILQGTTATLGSLQAA